MADSKSVPLLQPGITGEETACVDVHKAGGHGDKRTKRDIRAGVEAGQTWLESTGVASIYWHSIRGLAQRKSCAHGQRIHGLDTQMRQIAGKQECFKCQQEEKGTDGHNLSLQWRWPASKLKRVQVLKARRKGPGRRSSTFSLEQSVMYSVCWSCVSPLMPTSPLHISSELLVCLRW